MATKAVMAKSKTEAPREAPKEFVHPTKKSKGRLSPNTHVPSIPIEDRHPIAAATLFEAVWPFLTPGEEQASFRTFAEPDGGVVCMMLDRSTTCTVPTLTEASRNSEALSAIAQGVVTRLRRMFSMEAPRGFYPEQVAFMVTQEVERLVRKCLPSQAAENLLSFDTQPSQAQAANDWARSEAIFRRLADLFAAQLKTQQETKNA